MLTRSVTHPDLFSNRNRVVESMRFLDRAKEEYADVQIPLAVLE